jgi:hypothetical protein
MNTAPNPHELLQTWCREAVSRYGDNWAEIDAYIKKRLSEMTEEDRKNFEAQIPIIFDQVFRDSEPTSSH